MAAESYRKRLQDEITCFVCLDYFTAPVTLDCGHNFCRGCIVKSWGDSPNDVACPQCRERVEAKKLRPNKQLANMVQIAKELSSLLKHSVVPVEEAAQECKKQMEAEKKKTAAAFRQLHQFLEEQEKLLLAQMEEVEKEIARRREENLTRLSGELTSLDSLIREMEEKQQQQSVNELLQNIGNILERCQKEAFENPVAFPVVLKWKVHDFSDINPFLQALMKQFKDSLVSGLPLQEAKVTLDPVTAHPELILSEDCKSVRWKDEWQKLPDNPERFDYLPFVLGRDGFTAGRHYWNVEVGCEEEWSVGVAKKSMRRKGDFDSGPEEGIWDMGMWDGGYRISVSPERPRLSLSHELKTIRVTLNCAGGRVAFFNADTGVPLYVYSDTVMCRETLLPFFWVAARGHLTICP